MSHFSISYISPFTYFFELWQSTWNDFSNFVSKDYGKFRKTLFSVFAINSAWGQLYKTYFVPIQVSIFAIFSQTVNDLITMPAYFSTSLQISCSSVFVPYLAWFPWLMIRQYSLCPNKYTLQISQSSLNFIDAQGFLMIFLLLKLRLSELESRSACTLTAIFPLVGQPYQHDFFLPQYKLKTQTSSVWHL